VKLHTVNESTAAEIVAIDAILAAAVQGVRATTIATKAREFVDVFSSPDTNGGSGELLPATRAATVATAVMEVGTIRTLTLELIDERTGANVPLSDPGASRASDVHNATAHTTVGASVDIDGGVGVRAVAVRVVAVRVVAVRDVDVVAVRDVDVVAVRDVEVRVVAVRDVDVVAVRVMDVVAVRDVNVVAVRDVRVPPATATTPLGPGLDENISGVVLDIIHGWESESYTEQSKCSDTDECLVHDSG